jgi:Na+-translocating ferredoxin:NAD+ oxidoreductase RnfD subunit
MRRIMVAVIVALVIAVLAAGSAFGVDITSFNMVCSESAVDNDCLAGARAHVDIRTTVTDNPMLLFVICFGAIVRWMLAYGRGQRACRFVGLDHRSPFGNALENRSSLGMFRL